MAIAALILAVLMGNALVGSNPIGYHSDCIDGIDNDGDGQSDGMDIQCSEYPYADGNGETETPPEERSTSTDAYSSLFEYHRDYPSMDQEGTICFNIQTNGYDSIDLDSAILWTNENGVNCEAGGP